MKNSKYILFGAIAIICAVILGRAYTYKYRSQDTIVVTGLGETQFESDLTVFSGVISAEAQNIMAGYDKIEDSKQKVLKFLTQKGIAADSIVFEFVNYNKQYESVYANGSWAGQKFTGYNLTQRFVIESRNVDLLESISREISSLIAQGVSLEMAQLNYYYTQLDELKHGLIEKASADARMRAEKIGDNAGADIDRVASARLGVFQITGANSNEEFSAGGSFNTTSRHKKARITIKVEYRIR